MNSALPESRCWVRPRWIIAALGVLLCLVSILPFTWVSNLLGSLEPDGSFNSLTMTGYQWLTWGIRFLGLIFIVSAIVMFKKGNRLEGMMASLCKTVRTISIKEDGLALWTSMRGEMGSGSYWLVISMLVFLAAIIRLALINYPVRYDEAYTFIKFSSRPIRYILTDYSAPNNHIFHSLLVSFSYQLFGMHLWSLRLPALVSGILSVVAAFLAGRKLYGKMAGTLAAAGIALAPMMIDFSVNARGYSLLCLFSLLGLWLASEIIHKSRFLTWSLLVLVCGLGFFTIPIFLYPAGIIFLWLGLSGWSGDTGGLNKRGFFLRWFAAGISLGILVFFFYMPVLLVGTGIQSITSNEFVSSLSWKDFFPTLLSRIRRVWQEWNDRVPNWMSILVAIGFFLHLISSWRKRTPRIPVYLAALLWIAIALIAQRVTPLPRMWIFLLGFYLLWSAAGWCWLASLLVMGKRIPSRYQNILLILVLIFTWVGYRSYQLNPPVQESEESFNEQAAHFIASHIPEKTGLVGVSPTTIQVSYYLMLDGINWSRFYDRDRPEPIGNAWVVVVNRSKFPSVEHVLTFQNLIDDLDPTTACPIFTYKRLTIYEVAARP